MKMASAVRTGGKGTVRRKKKAVHKTTSTDDKRLQNTLKRLGVNTIPGIEEVNLFMADSVIHFSNPKVQASIAANTYVVSGPSQTKKLQELFPNIIPQLGQENMAQMRNLHAQMQGGSIGGGGGTGSGNRPAAVAEVSEEDDDVPELVDGQTFDS